MTVAERKEHAEEVIDCSKHIWEGWTVQDFIDALEFELDMIMSGRSWKKPFKTKTELKAWCADNQPYYKKAIPEVIEYFSIFVWHLSYLILSELSEFYKGESVKAIKTCTK